MKELWTANPFCLMNRPFAEMGYNSSGLNIAPERFLLATRRPFTHHPLASGAPSFDPLRATRRRATNHATHGTTSGDPPLQAICRRTAQHPPSRRKSSAISLRAILWPLSSIRRLSACHLPASSPRDTRQPNASHLPSFCTTFGDPLQAIRHRTAQHPSTPRVIRWHLADTCRHEPMPLTTRRTSHRHERAP